MRAAGIPDPKVGMAWNPNDTIVGQAAGEAKIYLQGLPRVGSAKSDENVQKLNTTFAKCAAKFLKDYQQRYGAITIRSAYRSPAYDAQMCRNNPACGNLMNNPNPQGNHQKGLAMDIAANSGNQQSLWDFARNNPQYGVCFPFTGEGGGFKDTVHMILAGISSSETKGPGCRGVTKPCDGQQVGQSDAQTQSDQQAQQQPPLQQKLDSAIRQALGLPTQQPAATAAPSLPSASAAPASSAASPVSSAVPATPGTTQTTSAGANGTNITPTSVNAATPASVTNVPSSIHDPTAVIDIPDITPTSTAPTSSIRSIDAYANPTPTTVDIGSAVAIDLTSEVIDPNARVHLEPITGRSPDLSGSDIAYDYAGTSAGTSGNTFTSDDLANSPVPVSEQPKFLVSLTSTLAGILAYLTEYLRPFGGIPARYYVEL